MPFRVSGKNIDVGEALRTKINTRIAEVTAKYFDGGYSGHVTVGKDGFCFIACVSWAMRFSFSDARKWAMARSGFARGRP